MHIAHKMQFSSNDQRFVIVVATTPTWSGFARWLRVTSWTRIKFCIFTSIPADLNLEHKVFSKCITSTLEHVENQWFRTSKCALRTHENQWIRFRWSLRLYHHTCFMRAFTGQNTSHTSVLKVFSSCMMFFCWGGSFLRYCHVWMLSSRFTLGTQEKQ